MVLPYAPFPEMSYAVRAVFELAKRQGTGAIKISEIAEAQVIPTRFLENILNNLKRAGFVESVRGKDGGYLLARSAKELTVGEIVRSVEGPLRPVECATGGKRGACSCMATACFFPSGSGPKRHLKRFTTVRHSRNS